MTERERWIIYPLLFFALGAALRDKFLQHVTTKEVFAGKVVCEELLIADPKKPDRIVAKLSSSTATGVDPTPDSIPFGILLLFDREGQQLCGVTNQALSVREINCFGLKVVDPDNANRALAALTSAAAPPSEPGGLPRRFGVLALNNQKFGRLVGVPPAEPGDETSPSGAPATEGSGEETLRDENEADADEESGDSAEPAK